jgi:hypothetical protein
MTAQGIYYNVNSRDNPKQLMCHFNKYLVYKKVKLNTATVMYDT